MKLQDIYRMAENWRTADNKRYSVEFTEWLKIGELRIIKDTL